MLFNIIGVDVTSAKKPVNQGKIDASCVLEWD